MSDTPTEVALEAQARAGAVLVTLRYCCRTTSWLKSVTGDENMSMTQELLVAMSEKNLIRKIGQDWYLEHDGVAWLELHELSVSEMSKAWVAEAAMAAEASRQR